jgi:hypothetical protein
VAGVTKALQEYGEREQLNWLPEAISATADEYRAWKVDPEGASIASPANKSQLDRIEHGLGQLGFMLSRIVDALGIPMVELVAPDDAENTEDTEQAGVIVQLPGSVPYIQAAGGLGYREPQTGSLIEQAGPVENVLSNLTGLHMQSPAGWGLMYAAADHDVPEDAEAAE